MKGSNKSKRGEEGYRLVPLDDVEFREVQDAAGTFDMSAGRFMALVMRNYLKKRWPLELVKEIRPQQERKSGT